MGNALQAKIAAVDAGFIGKNPLEGTLAAIDKGIKGVQDWKTNIDKQRLELKQNTAKQIRDAEKLVYENMPSDETAQAKVLEGLEVYKTQMLMNQKLVQNGAIDPGENLIFFENGKQTFDIFAKNVSDYDKELELTRQRAQGYTDPETGEFIKPTSGAVEAAQQQIQGALANLNGMDINFTEKGMGSIQFYEMELAEDGVTMRPKLDDDNNKIPTKGANLSVLALKHPANGRSDRVYLIDEVQAFSESSVAKNYEIMVADGASGMIGNVVNDARNNPQLKTNINNQVAAMTSTITQASSILSDDNGIGVKYIPFNQYESDEYWKTIGEDKNATITIDILDENLQPDQVEVPKYVKVGPTSNNSITAHFPPDQNHMEAVQGYTRKSLVDGLQRKVEKGVQISSERVRSGKEDREEKKKFTGEFEVASRIAAGGDSRTKTLTQVKNSTKYTNRNGYNEIQNFSQEKELDTNGDGQNDSFGIDVTVRNLDGEIETLQLITRDSSGNDIATEALENNVLNILGKDPVEIENMRDKVGDNYTKTKTSFISLDEKTYQNMPKGLKDKIIKDAGGEGNVVVQNKQVFKKVKQENGSFKLEPIQIKDNRVVDISAKTEAEPYKGLGSIYLGVKDGVAVTASDQLASVQDDDQLLAAANNVITNVVDQYNMPPGFITVEMVNEKTNWGKNGFVVSNKAGERLFYNEESHFDNKNKLIKFLNEYFEENIGKKADTNVGDQEGTNVGTNDPNDPLGLNTKD